MRTSAILKKILSKKDYRFIFVIFFLMLCSSFIEAFSIGILIPLLSVFFTETANTTISDYLLSFLDLLNLQNSVYILLSFTFLIYIFKYIFIILYNVTQSKFILGLNASLKTKMFDGFIDKPFIFHTNTNSSTLISTIDKEVGIFINNFLSPSLMLLMNCMTSAFIVALLLLVNFKVTVIILMIFLFFLIFSNKFFSSKLKFIGKERQKHERFYMKYLQQGLGGILEVKMLNFKKILVDNFFFHRNKIANIGISRVVIGVLPRIMLELLFIIIVFSIIAYTHYVGDSLDKIFSTLIIYATAAFRLMPAMNAISYSYQKIKFSDAAVNSLVDSFDSFIKDSTISNSINIDFNDSIKIQNLSFCYPGAKKNIIHNLSFDIKKGDKIGIIGGNGSGKTTLLSLICGLLEPSNGTIKVDDKKIAENLNEWKKKIGYIPQNIYLFDDSLSKNISLAEDIDLKKINDVIERSQLKNLIMNLPDGVNTIIGEKGSKLSGGEKQKIAIARVLYRNSEIMLFDEFTSAMDLDSENKFIEEINRKYSEKTIIIVSHRKSALKYCKKIYNMDNQTLVN